MAADKGKKESNTDEDTTPQATQAGDQHQATQAGDQPRVVWDSTDVRSAYANVFNVIGAREEFVLFFGMNQAFDATQQELRVQLNDRIVLSPYAAKRLSTLLNNVIQDYETRFGPLENEAAAADTPSTLQ